MAITELVDVANMALLLTGAKKIDSLSADSKSAELANLIAEQKRDECLDLPIEWNFATVRSAALTAHTSNPGNGSFDYYYALPASCMWVIATVDVDGDTIQYPFRIELDITGTATRVLACNETSVYLKYIYQVTDVAMWPSWFKWLVACRIALVLVEPLKQDGGELKNKIKLAYKDAYAEAKSANAAWGADTSRLGQRVDDGNNDILNAASDEIDYHETRIIER
jgi:hypothetical protein